MEKKKGFVFVETMIVVVTVLTSLLLIYSAYTGLVRVERKRVRYDDPAFIYKTQAVADFLLTLYDDEGKSIIGNKISENKDLNDQIYINIPVSDIELFSSEYGNGNEKRKTFFSSMYNNLHIQNIFMISKKNIAKLSVNKDNHQEIPRNFLNYILSINTTSDDNNQYYLIVEYAEKIDGSVCSPNQLINNNSKVESSCTFFYSNLKITGV